MSFSKIFNYFIYFSLIFSIFSCNSNKAVTYDFPSPVDTKSRAIEYQEKRIFSFDEQGIYVDNQFDGARLNDFIKIDDNHYQALIKPENTPINKSPWYAFRIWAKTSQEIQITLVYSLFGHRYHPKISSDGQTWVPVDSTDFELNEKENQATFKISVGKDTTWIAAQELTNSTHVKNWCQNLAKTEGVEFQNIGKSKLGRDLMHVDIGKGEKEGKEIIAILSRQHPPEVTGYFAMQAFIHEIVDGKFSDDFLKKYRVLVYPLLNPDGVDLGHWRHNTGGIDLNRDWAYYHQAETRQVANHISKEAKKNNSKVILGLDFHSTYEDVYYTNLHDSLKTSLEWFNEAWFEAIEENIEGYEVNNKPSGIGKPVSKTWFYTQFKAEGITYEIGDDTPRDFIKVKGQTSAREMMRLLLEKANE